MNREDQLYKQGFNNGYAIAKYEPNLMNKIINLHPANDYLTGFSSGKEEYELEYARGLLSDLNNVRTKLQDREENLERE